MCASAIFVVGTSGIPPKLNYRRVKSCNGDPKADVSIATTPSFREGRYSFPRISLLYS